jgi:hypothetical protein
MDVDMKVLESTLYIPRQPSPCNDIMNYDVGDSIDLVAVVIGELVFSFCFSICLAINCDGLQ